MRLQEALFLSSQRKAIYEHGLPATGEHAYRCYRVQVEITVSRREGETVYPPHLAKQEMTLDACIDYLREWTVGEEFENPWHPVDEWEDKQEATQTIKDELDAINWCREHGASYNTVEGAVTLTNIYLNGECIGVDDTLEEAVRDAIAWLGDKEQQP